MSCSPPSNKETIDLAAQQQALYIRFLTRRVLRLKAEGAATNEILVIERALESAKVRGQQILDELQAVKANKD